MAEEQKVRCIQCKRRILGPDLEDCLFEPVDGEGEPIFICEECLDDAPPENFFQESSGKRAKIPILHL